MELTEARGRLVAVGGAEDREGECEILKEFIKLAGGPRAHLLVVTYSTDEAVSADQYVRLFKRLGVDDTHRVAINGRDRANAPSVVKLVKRATGLYFTGGDQLDITSLFGGTEFQRVMHERYEKDGLVIGGTSAGASMMGNSMILGGGEEEAPRLEGVRLGPGMDLIVGAIIDTHFSQRGRHGRLITAAAHYPQDLCIGIDENTAMLINKQTFEVVGEGCVTVIDAGEMTYTNMPEAEVEEPRLTLHGIVVHVLAAGARYDLSNHQPVRPEGARARPAGRNSESGSRPASRSSKKSTGGKK
jgi:cyanophycinase